MSRGGGAPVAPHIISDAGAGPRGASEAPTRRRKDVPSVGMVLPPDVVAVCASEPAVERTGVNLRHQADRDAPHESSLISGA